MALKTTPMATDADSYVTLAEANDYLATNPLFMALADSDKETLLKKATMQIDSMRFFGEKSKYDQALSFPRIKEDYYGMPITETEIPVKVKFATCEQAAYILSESGSKRLQLQAEGVKSYSIGDLSETFGGANTSETPVSVVAKGYLKGLISRIGRITNY